jgi:tetratricopeptide (TPR) repeat protein
MKVRSSLGISALISAAFVFVAAPQPAFAQGGDLCPIKQFSDLRGKPSLSSGSAATAPKLVPGEESAYKAFFKLKPEDTAQRLQAGDAFVRKFPDGPFTEAVYSQMSMAAYHQQDFPKMEEYAAKALAINPDDVTVMVFTGWVIPHSSTAAPEQLDKAEKYEKRVIELLPAYARPAGMTDQELAAAKLQYEAQAHSGLGLVDYRRDDFTGAVAELTKATSGNAQADPADYFVLGSSLDRLNRFTDAATAFDSCSKIPGGEQTACQQKADDARKSAASAATKTTSAKL